MREFGNKKTHASNGQELSDIFIGEDGLLSVFFNDQESEIVGYTSNVFQDAFTVKYK